MNTDWISIGVRLGIDWITIDAFFDECTAFKFDENGRVLECYFSPRYPDAMVLLGGTERSFDPLTLLNKLVPRKERGR